MIIKELLVEKALSILLLILLLTLSIMIVAIILGQGLRYDDWCWVDAGLRVWRRNGQRTGHLEIILFSKVH